MNGFIILCVVFMGIFLYLWALTQSQCNNNAERMNKGLEAIRDALQAMTKYAECLEARIKILEEKVEALGKRTVIGYTSPLTWDTRKQQNNDKTYWREKDDPYNASLCTRKIGVIRIDSGNLNETNETANDQDKPTQTN